MCGGSVAAMRLIAVELTGYRRFADPTRIDVDGPLTAIVGPNEAGKTSLLDAMLRGRGRSPRAAARIARR